MKLAQIERTYLMRAFDRNIDLSFENAKVVKAAKPTIEKLVSKGLLRRIEIEGEDDLEIYEITEEGIKAIKFDYW